MHRLARPARAGVRALVVLLLSVLGLTLMGAAPASAHPLGNFTVNSADRVQVVRSGVAVLHVLDLAEVPTLQLSQPSKGVDTNGDGELDDAELTSYAKNECVTIAGELTLSVDGSRSPLSVAQASGQQRPGQAGLATARLECRLTAPDRPLATVALTDEATVSRNGWKEITLLSSCGRLAASTVPTDSASNLLTAYPQDLLRSPLNVTSASAKIEPGGPCTDGADASTTADKVQARGVGRLTAAFTDFVKRPTLTPAFVVLAVLLSIGFGAAHAVAPGHGKTVVAAYLIGQRGTRRQALWLGATVTVAHTGSVLALGALLTLTTLANPELLVPYAEVLSGLLLALLGGYLLYGARRTLRVADHIHDDDHHHVARTPDDPDDHEHPHDHDHEHPHDHGHEHPHDHGHGGHDHGDHGDHHPHGVRELVPVGAGSDLVVAEVARTPVVHSHGGRRHSHAPLDDKPLGWRSLATMGLAGGLVPSPSALIVLLGATALGRAWFGVILVLFYGLGMAMTLTAAGLFLLRTQAMLTRRGWAIGEGSTALRLLPLITAGLVVLVGAVLVVRGLVTAGGI